MEKRGKGIFRFGKNIFKLFSKKYFTNAKICAKMEIQTKKINRKGKTV